jgi:hypothetical protein
MDSNGTREMKQKLSKKSGRPDWAILLYSAVYLKITVVAQIFGLHFSIKDMFRF